MKVGKSKLSVLSLYQDKLVITILFSNSKITKTMPMFSSHHRKSIKTLSKKDHTPKMLILHLQKCLVLGLLSFRVELLKIVIASIATLPTKSEDRG